MKNKTRIRIRIKSVIAILVLFTVLLTPMDVSAASKKPYKDVTVKKVGKIGYQSVKETKRRGVWNGIVKNDKFEPKKVMKWGEVIKALQNDNNIGKKYVPITKWDKKNWKKPAKFSWYYKKMSVIAKKKYEVRMLGVVWDTTYKDSAKITRIRLAISLAAKKDPFTDVTKKTVIEAQWLTVVWCKAHGVYDGIISGKTLGALEIPPRSEFCGYLINLYTINMIPAKYYGDIYSNEPVTVGWICSITSDLAINLEGEPFNWIRSRGDDEGVTRAQASNMLWTFAAASKSLMPKQ